MSGISRYEKVILLLTAGFLLFCGGWFLARQERAEPYQVTVTQNAPEETPEQAHEQEGKPDSLLPGERIDLNTADVYDLQRLPGIGEKRAADIVAFREEHGPFETAEDLMQVSGIGEGTFEKLKDYVAVSAAQTQEGA